MTMKVTIYGIPWISILILGIVPNGLLDEKSTICRYKGASCGGNNLNFHLNFSIMAFTFDPPSKRMSSIMFFPTYTMIIVV